MEQRQKRYIISREPIGTANKLKDLTAQITKLEAALNCLQDITNSLVDKFTYTNSKIDDIKESSAITHKYLVELQKNVLEITIKTGNKRRIRNKKSNCKKINKSVKTELPSDSSTDHFEPSEEFFEEQDKNQESQRKSCQSKNKTEDVTKKAETDKEVKAILLNSKRSCNDDPKTAKEKNLKPFGNKERKSSDEVTRSSVLLTLNKEEDFPNGCWLGDKNDVNRRVRVSLSDSKLDDLLKLFTTPEKLALALMDRLFSRDIMATSNLTGKGKHNKKQLDPLIIYGIYCELRYIHNISEEIWSRIKNNMESKCRALWRRKIKANKKSCEEPDLSLQLKPTKEELKDNVEGNCGNIVLYPLYQVDSNQLIQVTGLQNAASSEDKPLQFVSEVGLSASDGEHQHSNSMEVSETEQVVQLNDGVSGSIQSKPLDRDAAVMGQQTLTLAGGDLIMTDLGEVISITSEADVDCMMVSSVDYL